MVGLVLEMGLKKAAKSLFFLFKREARQIFCGSQKQNEKAAAFLNISKKLNL
jgi:hypothetical protein